MIDKEKSGKQSIGQLAEELEIRRNKAITAILVFRYAKREGIDLQVEAPIAYDFKPGFADDIINTFADLLLEAKFKRKKRIPKEHNPIFVSVENEIEKIWSVILGDVGLSGRVPGRIKKWQQAALEYFDKHRKEFQAIEREFLEDKELYQLRRPSHESSDFKGRLLRSIWKKNDLGTFGAGNLRKRYKNVTERKR
jgi:hypothetical protein